MLPPRTRTALAAAVAALALLAAGCGGGSSSGSPSKPVDPNAAEVNPAGDIPDNQAFVAYAPPGGGYSVKVPEGWSRTAKAGAVTFTDKLNAIRMEAHPAGGPLTVADAKGTELPALAKSVKGFAAGDAAAVQRKAGTAVRVTYRAASTADAVTGKTGTDAVERYVFFHHGRRVTLTLSGPKGADNVDPWRIVTDSLRWTG
jgi:hypothetical protein